MSQDVYMNTPSGGQIQLATMEAVNEMQTNIGASLGGKLVWTGCATPSASSTTKVTLTKAADYVIIRTLSFVSGGGSTGSTSYYIFSGLTTNNAVTLLYKGCNVLIPAATAATAATTAAAAAATAATAAATAATAALDASGTTLTFTKKSNDYTTYVNIEAYSFT